MEKKKRTMDLVIVLFFCSTIGAMGLFMFFDRAERPLAQENRMKMGASSIRDASSFEAFVNDSFGLREAFLWVRTRMYSWLLRQSTDPQVIVGKDGWLFFDENGHSMPISAGEELFDSRELALWEKAFSERCKIYQKRKARYVVMLAPEKQTIYPEFVPARYQFNPKRTQLDQVLDFVKPEPGCSIIDLRKPLRDGRLKANVFQKSDSHWNSYGAYLTYLELSHVAGFNPIRIENISTAQEENGDLSRIIGMPESSYGKSKKPDFERQAELENEMEIKNSRKEARALNILKNPHKTGSIAFSGDSFMPYVAPFLFESFGRSYFIRSGIVWDHTRPERTDFVVEEMVERNLKFYPLNE